MENKNGIACADMLYVDCSAVWPLKKTMCCAISNHVMLWCLCVCVCVLCTVGAEVVLGGAGHWMVSTATQTGEQGSEVQITVPLQQVYTL